MFTVLFSLSCRMFSELLFVMCVSLMCNLTVDFIVSIDLRLVWNVCLFGHRNCGFGELFPSHTQFEVHVVTSPVW